MIPQLTFFKLLKFKHKEGHIDSKYFELFKMSHVHLVCLCKQSYENDPGLNKVCSLLLSELLNNELSTVNLESWVRNNYESKRKTLNIGWNSDVQHLFVKL